jgi:hypothetical protein
MSSIGC